MTNRTRILGALVVFAILVALGSKQFLDPSPRVASIADPSDHPTETTNPKPTLLEPDPRDASPPPSVPAAAQSVDRTTATPAAEDDDLPCWIQVVDFASGAPLEHVTITAELGVDQAISYTDRRGYAHVESSKKKPRLLQLDLDGYSTAYLEAEASHERADRALRSSMSRTATLRAHVRSAAGVALQHTQVTLEAADMELRLRHLTRPDGVDPSFTAISTDTDSGGNATIAHLPAGIAFMVTVFAPKPWSPPAPIVLNPGEVRDVDWTLSGGCTLRGLLLDQDDRPVIHRPVWITQAWRDDPGYFLLGEKDNVIETSTDELGRFLFAELDAASWWVGPAPTVADESATPTPERDVAPLAQVVRIERGQTTHDVTLHVDRGLYIRGHVVDAGNAPAADVHIHAVEHQHHLHAGSSSRDPDGAFAIGPLMRGTYTLSTGRRSSDADAEPVVAEAGRSDVVLRLRAGATLSGQVVGMDSAGVSALLHVADPSADADEAATIHTDQAGHFVLRGLAPGVFDLVATTDDGCIGSRERVAVSGGSMVKDVVVHVRKGGRVRVRNAGPEPSVELQVIQGGASFGVHFAQRNLPVELTVPAGTSVIRARYAGDDGRTVERSVSVAAEETVELVLEAGAK